MGPGRIGRSLVAQAVDPGNNVVVIDQDELRCYDILENHNALAIAGNATDRSVPEEAEFDHADAFVATMSDDAVTLMA